MSSCRNGRIRTLPERVLSCYASWGQCDASIEIAAAHGCNVINWFAINILRDPSTGAPTISGPMPNLACVAGVASRLAGAGLPVTHLISVGGWNAPPPDDDIEPAEAWRAWKRWNEEVVAQPALGFAGFDGIDWDLEGDTHTDKPANRFSLRTLDLIGQVSQARALRALPAGPGAAGQGSSCAAAALRAAGSAEGGRPAQGRRGAPAGGRAEGGCVRSRRP